MRADSIACARVILHRKRFWIRDSSLLMLIVMLGSGWPGRPLFRTQQWVCFNKTHTRSWLDSTFQGY